LICRAEYSLTSRPRSHAGHDRRTARLPQLERRIRAAGEEHLLDGQFRRPVLLHQFRHALGDIRRRSGSGPGGSRITPLVM
jgi:hypothetical protein